MASGYRTGSLGSGLQDCRILVVEDEFFIADDVKRALERMGAEVLGPVPTWNEGLALVEAHDGIHLAVLDINLQGEEVFPLADRLMEKNIPLVFTTGYSDTVIPAPYRDIPRWEKPFDPKAVAAAIAGYLRQ